MLTLIGDVLNWLVAGIVFPLMLLPLALAISGGRKHILAWLAIVIIIVAACILFAWLTPALSATPSIATVVIFTSLIAVLTALISRTGGVAAMTKRLTPFFEVFIHNTARIVMWFLLFMALIQFGVVVLRYVFGINYIFMQESITYMHGAVFLLTGGYALLTDDHVRVDIFYGQASPKRKALINLLGTYLLLFPVCLVLLWAASPYVASSWAVTEGSTETSGIQAVFLMKSLIPAFAILLLMAGFNIAARASATLKEPA
jgi:TRAP-type mannitol/chloroaromatic compound transport system permease small subunit